MKNKIYIILLCLIVTSSAFGEQMLQNQPKFQIDKNLVKTKDDNFYLRVGTTPFIQNIGFGKRFRNIPECKGTDLSMNLHFCAPLIFSHEGMPFLPTIKYSLLRYKKPIINSSYSGVGFELGCLVYDRGIAPLPIPNIELIWGKQFKSNHFHQFGINLLPVVGGIVFMITNNNGFKEDIGITTIGGTGISYSFGF